MPLHHQLLDIPRRLSGRPILGGEQHVLQVVGDRLVVCWDPAEHIECPVRHGLGGEEAGRGEAVARGDGLNFVPVEARELRRQRSAVRKAQLAVSSPIDLAETRRASESKCPPPCMFSQPDEKMTAAPALGEKGVTTRAVSPLMTSPSSSRTVSPCSAAASFHRKRPPSKSFPCVVKYLRKEAPHDIPGGARGGAWPARRGSSHCKSHRRQEIRAHSCPPPRTARTSSGRRRGLPRRYGGTRPSRSCTAASTPAAGGRWRAAAHTYGNSARRPKQTPPRYTMQTAISANSWAMVRRMRSTSLTKCSTVRGS